MPLHTSGSMSLNQIRGEFGGTGQLRLSQFYRGGGRVPNSPKNYSISTGGRIAHSMFYGASKEMTALDAVNLAIAGMTQFGRENGNWIGSNFAYYADGPYKNGWWGGAVFPNHKSGAGEWNYTWYYNNMSFAPTEDKCTVVIIAAGRNPGAPSIQSVRKTDGNYVGFTEVWRSYHDAVDRVVGEAFAVYEVACDRREVAAVNSYHTTWHTDRAHCTACHVLPGGNWRVLSVSGGVFNQGYTITAGDMCFVSMAGYAGWRHAGLGTWNTLGHGSNWGNGSAAAIATCYGDSTRGFYIEDPYMQKVPSKVLLLRKLPDGQTGAANAIHNNYLTTLTPANDVALWVGAAGNPWSNGYRFDNYQGEFTPGHIVYLAHRQGGQIAEEITLSSYSCSNPRIIPKIRNGRVYAVFNPISTAPEDQSYTSLTIAVRSIVSGQIISINLGAGTASYTGYSLSSGD